MRKKLLVSLVAALLFMGIGYAAYGQGPTGAEYTTYGIVNLGDTTATVVVEYYDEAGNRVDTATKTLSIPAGGNVTIRQKLDDPNLPDGVYSAVVSSEQPIAAYVNQQRADPATADFIALAPFSSYTGASSGSTAVTLPEVQHKWYDWDSLIRIQNAGNQDANVTITYYPGMFAGEPTGASGVTQSATIKPGAALSFDQAGMTQLGTPSGRFKDRFLGSAKVESTNGQPLVAMVNQNNLGQKKKFTYNGFSGGATEMLVPSIMAKHYGYYTSMSVGNPGSSPVNVTITYRADTIHTLPESKRGTTKTVSFTLQPGEASVRYEGDASGDVYNDFDRFFGVARITASGPIVAKINQEDNVQGQAGAFNGIPVSEATTKVALPLIQGGPFYGFYTSLTCINASDANGQVTITYTSDGSFSDPKNTSHTVTHPIPAGGVLNRWEGPGAKPEQADITGKPQFKRFLGSAVINSTVPIACSVNAEVNRTGEDTMYTFNAINVQP